MPFISDVICPMFYVGQVGPLNANDRTFEIPFISLLKGFISLKKLHFIVQERFNKLVHGINTIIKCGTRLPVKFQLVSRS